MWINYPRKTIFRKEPADNAICGLISSIGFAGESFKYFVTLGSYVPRLQK